MGVCNLWIGFCLCCRYVYIYIYNVLLLMQQYINIIIVSSNYVYIEEIHEHGFHIVPLLQTRSTIMFLTTGKHFQKHKNIKRMFNLLLNVL